TGAAATALGVRNSPLLRLSTFALGGNVVTTDLVVNGGFEKTDLTTEAGNLVGWQTYNLPNVPGGSHGGWQQQNRASGVSPLSSKPLPKPVFGSGAFTAMLDQADLVPLDPLGF